MKIGVLSDTHLREPHAEFKKMVERHFKDVDKILHVGDFTGLRVAEFLSDQKELIAVCGNMDGPDIRAAFPDQRVLDLCGYKIGLIHGGGSPFGIESRIRVEFADVDAIVYGHTHTSANHKVKSVLFFNPGSPTRSFADRRTIGMLHVGQKTEGEAIEGEIINL